MSFYLLSNDIISALSKTKIPSYHQFGEELIARRNDTFITVGITGVKSDEDEMNAEAVVSLYTPADFSGGKILSLASKIPEALISSGLEIKSIKASDLYYEKKLDRLCYDFTIKLDYLFVGKLNDTIKIGNTVINISSFSFSRKHDINQTRTLTAGVISSPAGSYPLSLSVKGVTELSPESFRELDEALRFFKEIPVDIAGAHIPSMHLSGYKLRGGRTAFIEAEFIEMIKEGNEENE